MLHEAAWFGSLEDNIDFFNLHNFPLVVKCHVIVDIDLRVIPVLVAIVNSVGFGLFD